MKIYPTSIVCVLCFFMFGYGYASDEPLKIKKPDGTELMRVEVDGKVMVGQPTAGNSEQLQVKQDVRIEGNLVVGGTIQGTVQGGASSVSDAQMAEIRDNMMLNSFLLSNDFVKLVTAFSDGFACNDNIDDTLSSEYLRVDLASSEDDTEITPGSIINSTASNNITRVDFGWTIDNNKAVKEIGVYSLISEVIHVKIVRRNSPGNYDVITSQAVTHDGTGWNWFQLTTPYTIPASGDYHVGVYNNTSPIRWADTNSQAYFGGNATGSNLTFGENTSDPVPTGVKYVVNTSVGEGSYITSIPEAKNSDYGISVSGYSGNFTRVDYSYKLTNGMTVTELGVIHNTAETVTVKIVKRNSPGNYDVVASQSLTHTGSDWSWVTLTASYAIPASGDYYLAVYSPTAPATAADTNAQGYFAGNASGTNLTFTENLADPPVMGAKYNSDIILVASSVEAGYEPGYARSTVIIEGESLTPNVDFILYASLDDGANWEVVTLSKVNDLATNKSLYSGTKELANRSDKTMRLKLTTHNNKTVKLHNWGMTWWQ